jgi:Mrp family chromosome partitioning ATPase
MIATAPHPHPTEGPLAETCRTLLRRLPWRGNTLPDPLRAVGLTSCHRGEGVSTVAAALARTAAAFGEQTVLLVDFNLADLAGPGAAERFGLDDGPGVTEVLAGSATWQAAVQPAAGENLWILPAGALRDGRAADAATLPALMGDLTNQFDLVLFDLPAAGTASAVLRVGRHLDGVLLVVEAERIRREVAARATDQLEAAGCRVLGAVLNKRREHVPAWLYRLM